MFSVLGIRILGYWVSGSWHWYLVVGIGLLGFSFSPTRSTPDGSADFNTLDNRIFWYFDVFGHGYWVPCLGYWVLGYLGGVLFDLLVLGVCFLICWYLRFAI